MTGSPTPDVLPRLREIAAALVELPGVAAVALGGSLGRTLLGRSPAVAGPPADADIYVYADPLPDRVLRAEVIGRFSPLDAEYDKRFWETEDFWRDGPTGVEIEAMYRDPRWISDEIDARFVRHEAAIGYTTAVLDSVRDGIPLADPDGWYAALRERAGAPYPVALRDAIVAKNWAVLAATHASFRDQIASAAARDDAISVNHRVAALLGSVTDIIFAVNLETHPGEKRQLAHIEARCPNRPARLRERIDAVLHTATPDRLGETVPTVDALLGALAAWLGDGGILPDS